MLLKLRMEKDREPDRHQATQASGRTRHPGWWVGTPATALAAGIVPALAALAMTAPFAPQRTVAGVFFVLVLVPAVQILVAAFFGWRPAAIVGLVAGALTLWQVVGRPPAMAIQPNQWEAAFMDPAQVFRSTLAPPPRSHLHQLLEQGGKAILFVCRIRGTFDDVGVRLGDHQLISGGAVAPNACWVTFDVAAGAVPAAGDEATVIIRPNISPLPAVAERTAIAGGYTRPRARGGQSGGGSFFDGSVWHTDDLSPSVEGAQTGHYLVELRITDSSGTLREVWY